MSWINDLFTNILQGQMELDNPGYREKRALLAAQGGLVGAQTEHIKSSTETEGLRQQQIQDFIDSGRSEAAAARINAQAANEGKKSAEAESERQNKLKIAEILAAARTRTTGTGAAVKPAPVKTPKWIKVTDAHGDQVFADPSDPRFKSGELRPPSTAQTQNRESQADIVQTAAEQMMAAVDSADKAGVIGPRAGRWQEAQEGPLGMITGGPSSEYAGSKAMLGSFEALLPILHGFRGGPQVIAQFQKSMGGGMNQPAENLRAAIRSLRILADDIRTGRAIPISSSGAAPAAPTSGGGFDPNSLLDKYKIP
jgi:hypothetical protein